MISKWLKGVSFACTPKESKFNSYLLDLSSIDIFFIQFQWGQNLELLQDRVLRYPERVQNLYFTFLFVLRAVTKVSHVTPLY